MSIVVKLERGRRRRPWLVIVNWHVPTLSRKWQTGWLWEYSPRISKAWYVPVVTLFAQNFLAFSRFLRAFLSAIMSPPFHGMLMPSVVLESVRSDKGFDFF
jgi:hypothetical protein